MKTNETITTILNRRSMRKYTEQPVAREDLETILACGQWAPSAVNRQLWCFVVLDDAEKVQKLAAAVAQAIGKPEYDMYKPTAAILVGHERDAWLATQDDGCAMENMMLAAESLGIASVWINQLFDCSDDPAVRAVLTEFGLPENYVVNAVCALGYAGMEAKAPERKSTVIWV